MLEIDKKFGKYVNPEVERKFLVTKIPKDAVLHSEIIDLYILDTTLRLRKAKTKTETKYKFAQKLRPDQDSARVILHTNIYIAESEFNLLSQLPANTLTKNRYQLALGDVQMWIDEFTGLLAGLVIAEVDFGKDGNPESFEMPSFAVREVTDDERFTGAMLAARSDSRIQDLLS